MKSPDQNFPQPIALVPKTPLEEYVSQESHFDKVKTRAREVATRRPEILNDSSTTINEERIELEKEALSLEMELKKPKKDKPLRTSYEAAMERHGKDNSSVENEVSVGSAPENIDEKTRKPKSPEELAAMQERVLKALGGAEKEVEVRAEKTGLETLIAVRKVGEAWKKVPSKYKYAIAGGLIFSGLGAVAVGSTAAIAGVGMASLALRGLGMASLFVGFETMLKTAHEKKTKEPRSEFAVKRHTIMAATLAVTIGALMPKMLHGLFDTDSLPTAGAGRGFINPYLVNTEAPQQAGAGRGFVNPELVNTEAPQQAGAGRGFVNPELANAETAQSAITAEKLAELTTVKAGQGFWQPVYNQLAAANPDWTKAQINKETLRLLVANDIINSSGSELRVSEVGMKVILNPDNTITYNEASTYTHTPAVQPEQPGGTTSQIYESPTDGETEATEYQKEQLEAQQELTATEQTATARQEILPSDPRVLVYAEQAVTTDINEVLGSKGFFGFFAQNGVDSINWKDAEVGFANQSVDKVLATHAFPATGDGGMQFGIENYSATTKMQEYLLSVKNGTGVPVLTGEKVADYIKRVATITISSKMNKG